MTLDKGLVRQGSPYVFTFIGTRFALFFLKFM